MAFKYIYKFFLKFRVGQRGAGLSATIARSEHEISEIIDGLSEQEVRKLINLIQVKSLIIQEFWPHTPRTKGLFVCK